MTTLISSQSAPDAQGRSRFREEDRFTPPPGDAEARNRCVDHMIGRVEYALTLAKATDPDDPVITVSDREDGSVWIRVERWATA